MKFTIYSGGKKGISKYPLKKLDADSPPPQDSLFFFIAYVVLLRFLMHFWKTFLEAKNTRMRAKKVKAKNGH